DFIQSSHPPMSRRFCLLLVKPSHYDDDGYVIQWYRSAIPSNSLAALYGLARDCDQRKILGDDVEMEIHTYDETNQRVRPEALARMIEAAGSGMVMLVGVQSNQFPRALDIARPLRARGIQVAVGGFHASGVLSMLQGKDPDLDRAREMGISVFAGEAEGRLDEVLIDAAKGALEPLYNYMADLPNLAGAPIPLITALHAWRTAGALTSFDAGRGCPFQCSFCTIINVQGRKSRKRSPEDVEQIIRVNIKQGLHSFFITDDNFARNTDWEPILDRIIELREKEGIRVTLILQVDTLCHKIPRFIEKCARAGVKRVFIGLENINPDTAPHPRMSRQEGERAYRMAWETYYTPEHTETVLRRITALRGRASNAILLLTWFNGSIGLEGVHPLEAGFLRKKFRRDRRPGLPIVPAWRFYPAYVFETVNKLTKWAALYLSLRRQYTRIKRDPRKYEYMDLALTEPTDDDLDNLELFHHNAAAEAYTERQRAPVRVALPR